MTFGEAISHNLSNSFRWSGRDPRSAFWWYALFVFLGSIAANMADGAIWMLRAQTMLELVETPEAFFQTFFGSPWSFFGLAPVTTVWSLINLVPLFSCGIRRRHDCDKSGTIFALVCLAGAISSVVGMYYMFQFFDVFFEFALEQMETADFSAPADGNPFSGTPFDSPEAFSAITRLMAVTSFLSLIQFAAGVTILIMMASRGTIGPNSYGPDPLAAEI